jgi:hypothetical protein
MSHAESLAERSARIAQQKSGERRADNPSIGLAQECQIWHKSVVPCADKILVVLSGEIKTPPLSKQARIEAGVLIRRLQNGELLTMPHSRPMPVIGPRCHELRTPRHLIDTCIRRLREWDAE